MIKRFFVPLSLLVLLLVSYGIYTLLNSDHDRNHVAEPNTTSPNVFMKQVIYDTYNTEGKLTSKLQATTTTYNKPHDQTLFVKPIVTSYSSTDDQPAWHITALHGSSNKNNTSIKLWGDVKFHRLANETSPDTVITTSQAMIYPKKSLAKTDQPVTIVQQKSVAHGTGMVADLKKGNYTLLSQTHGDFIPPDQP